MPTPTDAPPMLDINSVFTEGFIVINKSYSMQLDKSFVRHGIHL